MAALAVPRVRREVLRHSVEIHPEFTLAFVEFDDQGRFWNREQIDLLERIPPAVPDGIVINIPQRLLFLFGGGALEAWYPVALGRPDWKTPTGR